MTDFRVPELSTYEWQQSVLSVLADPPVSPSKGDRYIIAAAGASGDWTGRENEIAWCSNATGPVWTIDTPSEGFIAWNEATGGYLSYNGSLWVSFSTSPAVGDDVAFNIGDTPDYWFIYNSTSTAFEFWTTDSNGAGADGVVWSVQDETDDVNFAGDVNVTGTLSVGTFSLTTLTVGNVVAVSAGAVVTVSATSVTGDAIYGTSTAGICGHFYRNVSTPAGSPWVFYVHQDSSSDSSAVAHIRGDGVGDVLKIAKGTDVFATFASNGEITFTGQCSAGTGGGTSDGFHGESYGTGPEDGGVYGVNHSTGSGVVAISADGNGLFARGYDGRAAHFFRNDSSPASGLEVVRVEQDHSSDPSVAMVIQQDGSGNILELLDDTTPVVIFKDGGDVDFAGKIDVGSGLLLMDGVRVIYSAEVDGFTDSLFIGAGGQALSHTTGNEAYYNTSLGKTALLSVTTGLANTAFGRDSLRDLTTASQCTAVGSNALADLISGDKNTAVGYGSLGFITTGDFNVAIGYLTGRYLANGSDRNLTPRLSAYIGYNARASIASQENEIVIGSNAIGNGSNTITLGSSSTTDTYVTGIVHADGYKSSDGSTGATASVAVAKVGGGTRTLNFKNGLYIDYTDS